MATKPSPSLPAQARGLPPLRSGEGAAILLLLLACLTGLATLILRDNELQRPRASSTAQESWQSRGDLRQRIWELERRLLEAVPPSIEQKYGDL